MLLERQRGWIHEKSLRDEVELALLDVPRRVMRIAGIAQQMFVQARQQSRASLASLRSLLIRYADIPAPKTIVYVSEGLLLGSNLDDVEVSIDIARLRSNDSTAKTSGQTSRLPCSNAFGEACPRPSGLRRRARSRRARCPE